MKYLKTSKRIMAWFMILCLCLLLPVSAFADEINEQVEVSADEETETETELVARILDTDRVSTDEIVLFSSACVVIDVDSGQILYYKNPNDVHYPASITKVLTALLLIEKLPLETTITYTDASWDGVDLWSDMNIGMYPNEELTLEQSLHAILLVSANEVCNGAAIHASGSVEAFCNEMNAYAAQIGCQNTHFVNPNGLHDENHYTTAYDMALIARAAMKNEVFRRITGTKEFAIEPTNKRDVGFVLYHKHQMLMTDRYAYEYCVGGKTGYTPDAGNTLVTYAEKDGHTIACVIMENRVARTYQDTRMALDFCFDNYDRLMAQQIDTAPEVPVYEAPAATEAAEETEAETMAGIRLLGGDAGDGTSTFMHRVLVMIASHMPFSMAIILVGGVLLILALYLIIHGIKRAHHRRKYNKLRSKRIRMNERKASIDKMIDELYGDDDDDTHYSELIKQLPKEDE